MGTITVNVKDEIENEFRNAVKQKKGDGKGKLGEAITEAMTDWTHKKTQKIISNQMIELMEKGFKMGKLKIKSRDELYDR